ncbi:MAG: hypothetical protein A3H91_09600 [Gammaproteobacteria bacterium RIFCSPLOWO2_02_FULL_61_13]|nr:MAG: hypothetical protein A3H91_09600 [Gammaproteobacteria bacterium RIFCSPLOWO2_02_FULL_61_13]
MTGACIFAASVAGAGESVPDLLHRQDSVGKVEQLAESPGAHWVWVLDANLSSMPDGRAWLFDADSGRSMGSLNTGYSFVAFALPRAYHEIYSAETYYSRHTRGVRTDVVSVYDPNTLSPRAEIALPPKRASTIPRLNDSALTDDGRFMAVFNLTPATSLSIVDTRTRKFVGEIGIPGCSLAFPAGARTLFSLCFNGGALVTELNPDGSLSSQSRVEKLFDAEGDFIADNGARFGNAWLFPSLYGNLYPLEFTGKTIKAGKVWSLVTKKERRENWRISGYQGSAVHVATGRLFVLMHQGAPDTYKDPGTEVWVYDIGSGKRLWRIALEHATVAIGVSQDADAVLVGLDMLSSHLDVYTAVDGRHLRSIGEVGVTPALVQFPWQPPAAPGK